MTKRHLIGGLLCLALAATFVITHLFSEAIAPVLHALSDPHALGASMAMTIMPPLNSRARGIVGLVRGDAGGQTEIFEELKRTVEAFKAAHTEELKGIKAKFADVVQTEQVNRINDEITNLTKALDDCNAMIAALKIGGAGDDDENTGAKKEHANAFDKWFRKGVDNNLSDLEVQASLTTQSDPDGGFLVPKQTEATIDRVLGLASVMRQLATVMPIGAGTYNKFISMGGAGAGWVGEEDARPETNTPKLRELVFTVMEMFANPATTQKMLDDGIIDIAAWLADEVQQTFSELEGAAFATGDGVKKPRGFLSYSTVANANWAWEKIGYIPTGAAADFAVTAPIDAFIDLYYSLKTGMRNGAAWLMNDQTMGKARKFKDGDGNYIWEAPTAAAEIATILGKPAYTDDNMPAVGANAFPVAFGNWKRGYLILDRTGIRVLRDPYTNKPKIHFYTTKRVGGGVANFEAIKLLKCATS
ncbi:phage major capsid protein [Rhizobium sp. BK060]|uniref:phage major capsid protein n=1 Tax=Rhizobium sp. BK060 TaxID=2587096 RepID=UPI0017F91A81|nr:phage major capsid protein [Rhizobium sp. BK060]MBB3396866.1 HK97 family phage major capsid protein [Rhizobium sp. BK060]